MKKMSYVLCCSLCLFVSAAYFVITDEVGWCSMSHYSNKELSDLVRFTDDKTRVASLKREQALRRVLPAWLYQHKGD